MKYLFFLTVFFVCCVPRKITSVSENDQAKIVFESNLQFLSWYIQDNDIDTTHKVPIVVSFFEKLTSIESESDGNYVGKFEPTISDIEHWKNWFDKNKENIIWDSDSSIIKIIK